MPNWGLYWMLGKICFSYDVMNIMWCVLLAFLFVFFFYSCDKYVSVSGSVRSNTCDPQSKFYECILNDIIQGFHWFSSIPFNSMLWTAMNLNQNMFKIFIYKIFSCIWQYLNLKLTNFTGEWTSRNVFLYW